MEHAAQQRHLILATAGKDVAYDDAEVEQALPQRLVVRAVDRLRGILGKEVESLLPVELVGDAHSFILGHLLKEGLVDNLVAGEPGDVAADELAVHADGTACYLILLDLLGRQVLIHLLVEVYMLRTILLILRYTTEQHVVGVDGRTLVADVEKPDGLTPYKVETDVLVKLLVTAAATLL